MDNVHNDQKVGDFVELVKITMDGYYNRDILTTQGWVLGDLARVVEVNSGGAKWNRYKRVRDGYENNYKSYCFKKQNKFSFLIKEILNKAYPVFKG